ncbi:cytochrome P450 [Clavulina sp. PMI_390]|nr:cytochrome P450 [Clavulina sp. PMI_390]
MALSTSAVVSTLLLGLATYFVVARRARQLREQDRYDMHKLECPPNPHWLWGNEKEASFDRTTPEAWNEWAQRLGQPAHNTAAAMTADGVAGKLGSGMYRIRGALWHDDILVPTDPLAITHIISRNVYTGKYSKSPVFVPLIERLLGKSIAWAEGEDHRRMAKALAGCFSGERVRGMADVVGECAEKLSESLRSHIAAESSEGNEGTLMNVIGWPSRATLDIIGKIGFDHDFQCGESREAKEIIRLWKEQCELAITFPGFLAPILLRAFPIINQLLPKKVKESQEATKLCVRELAADLVKEELELDAATSDSATNGQQQEGTKQRNEGNLLSYLIRASKQDGKGVNVDELLDHIATFVLVGHETSAGVVSHTLHALAENQSAQSALRAELTAAGFVAGSSKLKMPTFEDLMGDNLPYLDAVAKEGLRMFVPPAQTERIALEDDVIPLGTPIVGADGKVLESVRVKKGQMILVSWGSINTNGRTWGPTGSQFRPERWLASEQPTPRATLGGFQHIGTFSEGPRICLGYRLAVLEVKMLLLTLVRDFQFAAVEKVPVVPKSANVTEGAAGVKSSDVEMMDVKMKKLFGGLVHPFIEDGEKAGMPGVWLPVRVKTLGMTDA